MEEQNEIRAPVSANDFDGLVSIINQYLHSINPEKTDILKALKHLFQGLASHNINKRKGYTLIVNVLLRRYREHVSEENAMSFINQLKFGKDKQKTAIRTGIIAKILLYVSFIKSQIIASEENILKIIEEIHSIGTTKTNLAPFSFTVLAEIQEITQYQYLQKTMELMDQCLDKNLDSYIFIFKVSQVCPEQFRELLPSAFQKSTFNDNTAKILSGKATNIKQPWNSDIWKVIANETPEDELFTFWPQILSKFIRSTEPTFKQNICALYIVRSVLPTLRPNIYNIVISSTLIRMINSLIMKPQLQPQINEFLNFVVDLSDKNKEILPNIIDSFAHIDFRQPGGFEFHLNLFNKCDQQTLIQIFQKIQSFDKNDEDHFKQRISSQKISDAAVSKFKLDTLRVVFISSSRFPDPEFSLSIFKYISDNWKEYLAILVPDIVKYDLNRAEGSATLSDLAGEPTISNFKACYKLYSICTGASSSPSVKTLIPPEFDDSKPSTDIISMAAKRESDSVLIQHAFKMYIKESIPQIPAEQIEDFFANYKPLVDSFTNGTIDIFQTVLNSMNPLRYNIIAPIFSLFCNTVENIGGNLIQPTSDLVKNTLRLLSNSPTATSGYKFPDVLNSIFEKFINLKPKSIKQNQKLINKTFETTMYSVIKAAIPLSAKWRKPLKINIDKAVHDFAFSKNQHFDEIFFSTFLRLSEDVTQILFPIVLKYLPDCKKLQKRIHLIDLVTLIFSQSKNFDFLTKYGNEFNDCVKALLDEDIQSEDDVKKLNKFVIALTKWFAAMENKRRASSHVDIGEFRRKLSSIQNSADDPLLTSIKQCNLAMQRIENQIHPKQRLYT